MRLFRLQRRPSQYTGLVDAYVAAKAAQMPACVDSSTYTFPCPANYTGACPANGLWTCADWQAKGIYTCEGPAAAAFGVDEAASIALLRECQSACPSTCTSPSRCTDDDACRHGAAPASVARGRPRKDALPERQAHSSLMALDGSGQHAVLWDVWERPEPLGPPGWRGHGTMSTRRA